MIKRTKVYWFHIPEYRDPYKEGLVGVSNNYKKRYKQHMKLLNDGTHNNSRFLKAYSIYGDQIIMSVLYEGTDEYCYNKEAELRPHWNIGWNKIPGGCRPPIITKDTHPEVIAKRAVSLKGINKGDKNCMKRPEMRLMISQKTKEGWAAGIYSKNILQGDDRTKKQKAADIERGIKRRGLKQSPEWIKKRVESSRGKLGCWAGKKRPEHSSIMKKKYTSGEIQIHNKGKPSPWVSVFMKGTDRMANTIWITNGEQNKRIKEKIIPDGWRQGQTRKEAKK